MEIFQDKMVDMVHDHLEVTHRQLKPRRCTLERVHIMMPESISVFKTMRDCWCGRGAEDVIDGGRLRASAFLVVGVDSALPFATALLWCPG